MKKIIISLLTLAMLLSMCVCAAAEGTEDPLAKYRTGSPWICSELDGTITEDTPVDLKDNFALAINRDFYINAEIPEGFHSTGTLDDVGIMNSSELLELFTDDTVYTDHDSQLAKAYFDLLMDWDTRNALGVAPLKDRTDVVEAIESLDALVTYYLEYPREKMLTKIFAADMSLDWVAPDLFIAAAENVKVILGDSAEYSQLTDYGATKKAAYHDLIVAMLQKLDYSPERAEEMWNEAMSLDAMMAPYILTSDETNSPDYFSKIYNIMTRDQMLELQGPLPVVQYVEETCGYGRQETWLVTAPAFFEAIPTIFTEENLPLIKSWMICKAALSSAKDLDWDCYELDMACDRGITGAEPLPYEIVAANIAQSQLKWQTAHMYCDKFFTQQDKEGIADMIDDVIAVYREMLQAEDFISEETKASAIRKLDTRRIRVLFPDDWDEYTDPDLTFKSPAEGGTLAEADEAMARYSMQKDLELVKKPVDHERWSDSMLPTTVNCFYNPTDNSINIMAAFCRGGIYNNDMGYEELCGKIGVVIAHEITHAFDIKGSQFDENGSYRNWWTDEDRALFSEMDSKMADYYSGMTCWEGEAINGNIKTAEACADMGAMRCMLNMAAAKEGFDYDTFFRSYADLWCSKASMYVIQVLQKDGHSMGYLRINTVLQQFDEFLDFYGITEGDGMYLAPADRVAIW